MGMRGRRVELEPVLEFDPVPDPDPVPPDPPSADTVVVITERGGSGQGNGNDEGTFLKSFDNHTIFPPLEFIKFV